MSKRWQQWKPPHGRDDAAFVRGGREGMYWQAGDGLMVRVAAPERVMVARDEPSGPVQAPARQAQHEAAGAVGPAGLVVALWVRLFAPSA